ncbi:MAG: ABC transporter permease [Bacillota bacterium]
MFRKLCEAVGKSIINSFEGLGKFIIFVLDTARWMLRAPNIRHLFQQMAHLGVDSLPIVTLTCLSTGAVMTLQSASELIKFGAQASAGGMVSIAMARELSPVLTAVVCAGRVGAALTAEIGTMKVTEQIDALEVMATNPIRYLVVPRVWACILMLPVLVVYADIVGVAGGYIAATAANIDGASFIQSIKTFCTPYDMFGGLLKSIIFGAIIGVVGCYKGMMTEPGEKGVGQSTTSSVVTAMLLLFFSNYFLSLLIFT